MQSASRRLEPTRSSSTCTRSPRRLTRAEQRSSSASSRSYVPSSTPSYASLPAFVRSLEKAGASGVVVFNRFYQPDIALETLDVDRRLVLSTPAELPLRLHALALLSPTTNISLGCTGGVHSGLDVAKAILSGAHIVQLASVLLEHGPGHVAALRDELAGWLDAKGYKSSAEARGVLDVSSAPDAHGWERLNYTRMLNGWRARDGWRKEP